VSNYLAAADVFFSFYDLSNVGNPLLEAIRSEKIIMTLKNGDTPKWISHKVNGFIYDPNSDFIDQVSDDLNGMITDSELIAQLKEGVKNLSKEKLWTWPERLNAEVNAVEDLLRMKKNPKASTSRSALEA